MITNDEIENAVVLIHGKSVYKKNRALQDAMRELEKAGRGKTISDLRRWMHDNPMVTNPILMVYTNLRATLLGTKFWDGLTKVRYENNHMKPISFIVDMALQLETDDILEKMKKAQVEDEALVTVHSRLKARRGSLLEGVRSGKYSPMGADQGAGDDMDLELPYSDGALSDTYQSKPIRRAPEKKSVTKKNRRKSLTKALSFVRGIGSSKKHAAEPKTGDKKLQRYQPKRRSSITMAIDAVKSVTIDRKRETSSVEKKKSKEKHNRVSIEANSSGDIDGHGKPEMSSGGWKDAERHYQY